MNPFRNVAKRPNGPPSLPIAEAIMIALADYAPDKITNECAKEIRDSFAELCVDPNFLKATSSGTNGKGAIKTRINMTKDAFDAHLAK